METKDPGAAEECKETGRDKAVRSFQRTEENLRIKPAAYKDLLRNRNFLLLWSGQMVSAIGDWVIVAILFAYVDTISEGKSYAISLVMLAKFMPAVLLGFLAGIIIDRLDRKRTLILCDISRAALVLVLPFAGQLLFICILVFIIETFTIIYGPAKDASIPDLVEPAQLTNANSLNMLTLYASMAFGTAIAGSINRLFTWLGSVNPGFFGHIDPNKAAFFIDSLSFLVSAWLIYHIAFKRRPEEERVRMTTGQVRKDFKEGFDYLWHHTLTRVILILTLACFLGGGTIYVLTVGFVKYVLLGSSSTFMYILTTLLFGMMGGSVLAGVLKGRIRKERIIGLAIAGFGIGVVIFSLITARWLSFIVAFVGGACMGYAIVGMVTLLHETLEEDFRGRAFATIQVIMRASIFLSIIVAGPMADLITSLGRHLGISPISAKLFRVGGAFNGEIDGTPVNFQYLLNGPQVILLVGGIVIFIAGLYGQHSFHRYFGWKTKSPWLGRGATTAEEEKCLQPEESPGGALEPAGGVTAEVTATESPPGDGGEAEMDAAGGEVLAEGDASRDEGDGEDS